MIVIADTSPINYLILIGEVEVLPALFTRIIVPRSVLEELRRPGAPEEVRKWTAPAPAWLESRVPSKPGDVELGHLGAGERDAILLGEELRSTRIIMDEIRGRREALRRQLPITGTLGVLAEGAKQGLLDLPSAIDRLRRTTFYVAPDILAKLIGDAGLTP